MEVKSAIDLIRNERLHANHPSLWTDLGCGSGLFTKALAHLLPKASTIYAVDKNPKALRQLSLSEGDVWVQKVEADFIFDNLSLPPLDGILMANALHFVSDKVSFLSRAKNWLKAEGCFLLVEYDTNAPNPWVPYPVPYFSLVHLFEPLGFRTIIKLEERPSLYHRAPIYAALLYP
jgi:trans-aconitate methyltransferase